MMPKIRRLDQILEDPNPVTTDVFLFYLSFMQQRYSVRMDHFGSVRENLLKKMWIHKISKSV